MPRKMNILLYCLLLLGLTTHAEIVGTTKGSFNVDQGAASYSLKIDAPPGSGGMKPDLSLNYSSDTGNGHLGIGWVIGGAPMISRCSQNEAVDGKNYVRGLNYTFTDRFCLDGARLINIEGGYGEDGTEYRTEIDTYAKVVSRGGIGGTGEPGWFEVRTKDGLLYEYGRTSDSAPKATDALTKQAGTATGFWKVNRISDRFGNAMTFTYANDSTKGENYLKTVSYGSNGLNNTINFVYEERPDGFSKNRAGYMESLTKRLTLVTVKIGSKQIRSYALDYRPIDPEASMQKSQLSSITEWADGEALKTLNFEWQSASASFSDPTLWSNNASNNSQYSSHDHSQFLDVDGDGLPDRVHYENSAIEGWIGTRYANLGYWVQHNNGNGYDPIERWSDSTTIVNSKQKYQYLITRRKSGERSIMSQYIDMNGDGLPDRVHHYNYEQEKAGLWVQLNNGPDSESFSEMQLWQDDHGYPGYTETEPGVITAKSYARNTAIYLDSELPNGPYHPVWHDGASIKAMLIDVTGDGLPDRVQDGHREYTTSILAKFKPGIWVRKNNGHGFDPAESWHSSGTGKDKQYFLEWKSDGSTQSQFLDINGDGLVDRVHHLNFRTGQYGIWVQLNTGHSFGNLKAWHTGLPKNEQYLPVWLKDKNIKSQFIDINGDGLPDRIHHNKYASSSDADDSNPGYWVQLNTGKKFTDMIEWKSPTTLDAEQYLPGWKNSRYTSFQDINGDGLPDRVHWVQDATIAPLLENIAQNLVMGIFVQYNTGSGFTDLHALSNTELRKNQYYINWVSDDGATKSTFADINGDGLPDRVHDANKDGTPGLYVQLNQTQRPVITRFYNESDQDISLEYRPLTDTSDTASNEEVYYNCTLHDGVSPFNDPKLGNHEVVTARQVVYRVNTKTSTGTHQLRFQYRGNIVHKLRGPSGFHEIQIFDETQGTYSGTTYMNITDADGTGFQYVGKPSTTFSGRKISAPSNGAPQNPHNLEQTQYNEIYYKDKVYYTGVDGTPIHQPYTYANHQYAYDPNTFDLLSTTENYNHLEKTRGFGNVAEVYNRIIDHTTGQEYKKTTKNTYAVENEDEWIIGRLTSASVTHQASYETSSGNHSTADPTIVTSSAFEYDPDTGILTKEVYNANADKPLTKRYTYDSFGNKKSETVSGSGVPSRTTQYFYDTYGRFQTTIVNALGHTETREYDEAFGLPTHITGPNGLPTEWRYDAMGRKILETRADGTTTEWVHRWGNAGLSSVDALYNVEEITTGKPAVRTYYDLAAREVGKYTYALPDGQTPTKVITTKTYNTQGKPARETLPHYEGETAPTITYTYDYQGRTTDVYKPAADGMTGHYEMEYDGLTVITTDANGNRKLEQKDARGKVVRVVDAYQSGEESEVTFRYDASGNLIETTDAEGNKVRMFYDKAGNKIKLVDPDMGTWYYSYNAMGELTAQTDAKLNLTVKEYDLLGRVTVEQSGNEDGSSYSRTVYTYDEDTNAKGKLIKAVSTSSIEGSAVRTQTQIHTYDNYGRPEKTVTTLPGLNNATTSFSYNSNSQVETVTYPNGYRVTNDYTDGYLTAVTGSDGAIHFTMDGMTAMGAVSRMRFGNNVFSDYNYDEAGFLGSIQSGYITASIADVQDLSYSYDAMGNTLTRRDGTIGPSGFEESFTYDAHDRLRTVSASSDVAGSFETYLDIEYDVLGNIRYRSDLGTYVYDSVAKGPHAVSKVGSKTYAYDANGNMTDRDGDILKFNPINKPYEIVGKNGSTVQFFYGIGGARYKKVAGSTTTLYVSKSYEVKYVGNSTEQIAYIYAGDRLVGHKKTSLNNANTVTGTETRYFHTDALGTVTAITDEQGNVVERRSTTPFGVIRALDYGTNNNSLTNITNVTERAFTGHEQIQEIDGLIHMNGRVYDATIGRFTSADPHIQSPHDSQSYNRYSYVRNNPLRYTDPTGYFWDWESIRKVVVVIVVVVVAYYTGGYAFNTLGGTSGGLAAVVGSGAAAGFASGVVGGLMNGAGLTQSLQMGAKGAAWGAVSAGVAFGIGDLAEAWSAAGTSTVAVKTAQAMMHGITRAIISKAQGGSYSAGFWSGFASSLSGAATNKMESDLGKVAVAAVSGGTVSTLNGGTFANGAVTGAFVQMYNDDLHDGVEQETFNYKDAEEELLAMDSPLEDMSGGVSSGLSGAAAGKLTTVVNKLPVKIQLQKNKSQVFYKGKPVLRIEKHGFSPKLCKKFGLEYNPTKKYWHYHRPPDMTLHRPYEGGW